MGAELGATTSIFPSDERTRDFFASMGRKDDWEELVADEDAEYDEEIVVDLSALEPLVAAPHMPDVVRTVRELDGLSVDQVAIGSCTNSSYADLKAVAQLFDGNRADPSVDLIVSPGSKQVLKMLTSEGLFDAILDSGARVLECACGPCIGMGGSPGSGAVSVRTYNRNFEGRSGTKDAQIYLASPLVAARCALDGKFSDPAGWGEPPARAELPAEAPDIRHLFIYPPEDGSDVEVLRGPNIVALEPFEPLPETIEGRVLLKVGDDITTDHIMPAGSKVLPLRSNVPAISEFVFNQVDETFPERAREASGGFVVGGSNYGQGSSREHAALAPRHLGVRAIIAKSLARIHRANLVNFGILPLLLENESDYDKIAQGETLTIPTGDIAPGGVVTISTGSGEQIEARNDLTEKELAIIKAGGLLNTVGK
jgi:aconitate hydratase